MKRGRAGILILGAAAAFAAVGCGREEPPNILLLTLDTLRADYVSYGGPAKAATPNLAALAERGAAFRNAEALIPITLPSHASILFGRMPHDIGSYNNGQLFPRGEDLVPIAELFKRRGYSTAAFVSLGVLEKRFGLDRGFDIYKSVFPKERWYLSAAEVNAEFLPWLESVRGGRFFGWVHYSDPHDPYAPPDTPDDVALRLNGRIVGRFCLAKYPTVELELGLREGENTLDFAVANAHPAGPQAYLARFDRFEFSPAASTDLGIAFGPGWEIRASDGVHFAAGNARVTLRSEAPRSVTLTLRGRPIWSIDGIREMYRREVEYLDRELGRVWAALDALGLRESTAVLVAGDHGEGLGEFVDASGEPHVGHIHYLYSYDVRVPLILADPRSPRRGVLRDDPATLLDVAPTLAALAGFRVPRSYQGRSLLAEPAPADRDVLTETFRPEAAHDKFGLRRGNRRLIITPQKNKIEAFDLAADPGESRNLYNREKPDEGLRTLLPILEAKAREILAGKKEIRIDKGAEDMLRALGYIK
jgi:arylsulfatase A-like enzyme